MFANPNKIFEAYQRESLPLQEAIDRLIYFAQKGTNIQNRIKSINLLAKITLKTKEIFSILENLLISDSSEQVRNAAINALFKLFPNKSIYQPLKFSLFHEDSLEIKENAYQKLIDILKSLKPNSDNRAFFLDELNRMKMKEFRIPYSELVKKGEINIFEFEELKYILINYLSFIYLKKSFWRIKINIEKLSVTELRFIFKGLEQFPLPIQHLDNIRVLVLRYNQLKKIPEWISDLTKLEKLNLNVNNLKRIPESIGNLVKLKEIDLWKNEIKKIPQTIGELQNLKSLNLRINKITSLPSSIGNLGSLQKLDLHDNNLTELPVSLGQLNHLIHLDLSWNFITHLPSTIGNLSNLEILRLEKNEIEKLPTHIGNLNSLKILHLRENKLHDLPPTIGEMKNLEILNISNNYLKEIPETIMKLKNLEQLHLAGNNLPEKNLEIITNLREKGVKLVL